MAKQFVGEAKELIRSGLYFPGLTVLFDVAHIDQGAEAGGEGCFYSDLTGGRVQPE